MNNGKVEVIEVSKPKRIFANAPRSAGALVGFIMFIIGVLFCISIILLIPGVFMTLIGLVVMTINAPKADIECPSCDYINKVSPPSVSASCERCKSNIPIKWVK